MHPTNWREQIRIWEKIRQSKGGEGWARAQRSSDSDVLVPARNKRRFFQWCPSRDRTLIWLIFLYLTPSCRKDNLGKASRVIYIDIVLKMTTGLNILTRGRIYIYKWTKIERHAPSCTFVYIYRERGHTLPTLPPIVLLEKFSHNWLYS